MTEKFRLWVLLFFVFVAGEGLARQGRARMTVSMKYRGERTEATFISNIHGFTTIADDDPVYVRLANHLEQLRINRYAGNRTSETKRKILKEGFFSHEPIAHHDELMILHRGMDLENPEANGPSGLGPEILGLVAVDRLGHPKPEYHASYVSDDYEKLLLERRLKTLGLKIPRPKPVLWTEPGLPPGVYPHWDPFIGQGFFTPGNVYVGDVIQVNSFIATNGLAPLIFTLASRYGLFSTGRIVYPSREKTIEGVKIPGVAVLVPSLIVWETFNEMQSGERVVGSRTRYYESTGAQPLIIDGKNEWVDPHLGPDVLVQILHKTADTFRLEWLKHLIRTRDMRGIAEIVIEKSRYESSFRNVVSGGWVPPNHQSFAHHPTELTSCLEKIGTTPATFSAEK